MSSPNGHLIKDTKRLIVLCDGTWVDSNAIGKIKYPTNVTRFARCIKAKDIVSDENGKRELPQIVYYQPGVGSTSGTYLRGGLYGSGVSATVRAAYAFLAHNYDEGDEIFFFGFSRGAYIARSIAGLVTSLGLLTKKGMDHFPLVYEKYYEHASHMSNGNGGEESQPFEITHRDFVQSLSSRHLLHESARNAVKVVGVWDTVGFHGAGMSEEKIEFRNCELNPRVPHAYHALALDERRDPFKPTLWTKPSSTAVKSAFNNTTNNGTAPFNQELLQVWFSGRHSDIGGGLDDPRLSDIALAWMIAQCSKDNKLAFTDIDTREDYLIDSKATPTALTDESSHPWATIQGSANEPEWYNKLMRAFYSDDRKPKTYFDNSGSERRVVNAENGETNEFIHRSIRDRFLSSHHHPKHSSSPPSSTTTPPAKKLEAIEWPSPLLTGHTDSSGAYILTQQGKDKTLPIAPPVLGKVVGPDGKEGPEQDVEGYFRGRVVRVMSAFVEG